MTDWTNATDEELARMCRSWGLVRAITGKLPVVPQWKLDGLVLLGLHDGLDRLTARGIAVAKHLLRKRAAGEQPGGGQP